MDEELLLQMLTDPELAKELAQMSAYGDTMGLQGEQAKRGAGLFGTPNAQGQHVGGTYVAASPLEHAGNTALRVIGAQKMNDADAARRSLISGDVNTRERFASALADAMRRSRQQPQIPVAPGRDPNGGTAPEGAGLDPYEF